MRTSSSLAVVVLPLIAALQACTPGGTACTTEAVAGLNVVVVDAATGERVCDATVTATDGDHEETVQPFGGSGGSDCSYAGAFERAGTYTITAEKDGSAPATVEDVVVEEGECHVTPADVELELAQAEQ